MSHVWERLHSAPALMRIVYVRIKAKIALISPNCESRRLLGPANP